MTKRCPIMSKQTESHSKVFCFEDECAFWNEEMNMCCIKSAAIAVAGKKDGRTSSTAQAYYIPPSSYCNTEAVSNTEVHLKPPALDTSYITF